MVGNGQRENVGEFKTEGRGSESSDCRSTSALGSFISVATLFPKMTYIIISEGIKDRIRKD